MIRRHWLIASFGLALAAPAFAQSLEVGKPAPSCELITAKKRRPDSVLDQFVDPGKHGTWLCLAKGEANPSAESLAGKVIFIEFWGTWCPPCVASMPEVQRIHERYSSRGLKVLAITNEPASVLEPFLAKNGYTFTVGSDPQERVVGAYGIHAFPTAFVIGKDGNVAGISRPFDLGAQAVATRKRRVPDRRGGARRAPRREAPPHRAGGACVALPVQNVVALVDDDEAARRFASEHWLELRKDARRALLAARSLFAGRKPKHETAYFDEVDITSWTTAKDGGELASLQIGLLHLTAARADATVDDLLALSRVMEVIGEEYAFPSPADLAAFVATERAKLEVAVEERYGDGAK